MENLTQEEKSEWLGKDSPVDRLLPTQDDSGDTFQQQNWRCMKILGRGGQGIITLYTEIDPSTKNIIDIGLTTRKNLAFSAILN